jgi:hypothetical protein
LVLITSANVLAAYLSSSYDKAKHIVEVDDRILSVFIGDPTDKVRYTHMQQQGNISNTMTYASGETDIATDNNKNNSTDEYEDLSQIKEHELDYKRRRKRIEFTDGLSEEELIKRANSSSPSSQAALSSSTKAKT